MRSMPPTLDKSMKNNFMTTTAIRPAPVSQRGRIRNRVAVSMAQSANADQKIDNEAWTIIERIIASRLNDTPAQWCSERKRTPFSQTNAALPIPMYASSSVRNSSGTRAAERTRRNHANSAKSGDLHEIEGIQQRQVRQRRGIA